ncbi:hypothetical protein PQX77_011146 [Marasmius sp. AFHP31]|nr:hypothetical protein PQX77_011146 [Marasmius sp. AFHP31]
MTSFQSLWAASGQSELENSRIIVIFGPATSTTILKNLALPGIGHFMILDHTKVTPTDVRNNFSLEGPLSIGKSAHNPSTSGPSGFLPLFTAAGELQRTDKQIDLDPYYSSSSKPDMAAQLRENKHICPFADGKPMARAEKALAEDRSKEQFSELRYSLDTLYSCVNTARAATRVSENLLDKLFEVLGVVLKARTGDAPSSTAFGKSTSSAAQVLDDYLPPE